MIKKAKERVIQWCQTGAGTKLAPPPPAQKQTDFEVPNTNVNIQPEEERVNALREERLGMLMMKELEENENKWIDYEDEDTQVKFDLADMILDDITGELVSLIMDLQSRK